MTDEVTVYVNGVDYSSNQYYLKIVERMNEVPSIEGNFFDIDSNNTDFVNKSTVYLKVGDNIVSPLFVIDRNKENSDLFRSINGIGFIESELSNHLVNNTVSASVHSQKGRPQYDNKLIENIVDEQLEKYSLETIKGTIDIISASIRSENDSLLSFFAGLSNVSNLDWFANYSNDLNTKSINITTRGVDKSATISLNMSGVNQNCEETERLEDYDSLKNEIIMLGYGDGINQLESYADHSTSIRNKLAETMSDVGTTIKLVDASSFSNNGGVWVGCEKCSYTGKTGNNLTGVTRGVEFRGGVNKQYEHAINSPVVDASYNPENPQSIGDKSSIFVHGRKQKSFTAKEIIDQSTLDIVAEQLLIERKGKGVDYSPPDRIVVKVSDYNWGLENIGVGDIVRIVDVDSNLNGDYRCYGRVFVYDINNGDISLSLEFSNTTYSVLSDIAREQSESVALSKYMQGSTNIYAVNSTDNADGESIIIDKDGTPSIYEYIGSMGLVDKFEDGDFTSNPVWTKTGTGDVSVQNVIKKEGTYALKFSANNNTYLSTNIILHSSIGAWSYWLRGDNNAKSRVLVSKSDSNKYFEITSYTNSGSHYFMFSYMDKDNNIININTNILYDSNIWYRVVVFTNNIKSNTIRFKIFDEYDDEIYDSGKLNNFKNGTPSTILISNANNNNDNCYFDTVTYGGNMFPQFGAYKLAQTFKPSSSNFVNKITTYLSKSNKSIGDYVKLEIVETSDGIPNNNVLSTSYFDFSNITNILEKSDFILNSPLELVGGETYAFVLSSDNIVEGSISLGISDTSVFPDIALYRQTITIFDYDDTGYDTYFKIHGATEGAILLFFEIPIDAIAINSVKLSYKNENPRLWFDSSGDIDSKNYAYTTNKIYILTTDDAETSNIVWTDRTSSIEEDIMHNLSASNKSFELSIPLTKYFSKTGWKGVCFITNGVSRHNVQVNIKCFIQSKIV